MLLFFEKLAKRTMRPCFCTMVETQTLFLTSKIKRHKHISILVLNSRVNLVGSVQVSISALQVTLQNSYMHQGSLVQWCAQYWRKRFPVSWQIKDVAWYNLLVPICLSTNYIFHKTTCSIKDFHMQKSTCIQFINSSLHQTTTPIKQILNTPTVSYLRQYTSRNF